MSTFEHLHQKFYAINTKDYISFKDSESREFYSNVDDIKFVLKIYQQDYIHQTGDVFFANKNDLAYVKHYFDNYTSWTWPHSIY